MPTKPSLRAGRSFNCENDATRPHSIDGIHILVRCDCGCIFRSTDATIALGMAQAHVKSHSGRGSDE